jgi:hypothetical protein
MLWDRIIEVAVIEWMTPAYAFGCHPAATEKAKTLNGLISILGT